MSTSFVTILFTDLVGATSMFDRRGDDAADATRREHFTTLRAVLAAHEGREIKSTGDGLMVTFASAVAAVRCAIAMQEATRDDLRIGLDAGEPLRDGEDLYGTPVIVASRLCDAAEPGEILATDVVCRIAGPRIAQSVAPAGVQKLRGIEERVAVARILWRGAPPAAPDEGAAETITTVIVDDERLLRTGFKVILESEPDIRVVGEAADGRTAIDVVRRRRPDVVLMDIRMPELDGLGAAAEILADPDLRTAVLMLTTFDLDEYVYSALRIGASGFLLKDTPAERLIDAVRVVASGEALLAPTITRRMVEAFVRRPPQAAGGAVPDRLADLTPRELDVLRLIARGLSNDEIAAELVLGRNTIKTHVARVLAKLGVRDRVQAVVIAYETGFVSAQTT